MVLPFLRAVSRWRQHGAPLPNPEPLIRAAREQELLRWSMKVLAADMAQRHYDAGLAGPLVPLPEAPLPAGLNSRSCRQSDIEAPWARHWCRALGTTPFYHRKLWEDCFILQTLWEAGMMQPGRRALCFAVGQEPLPAIMAAQGVAVLATDLDPGDTRARDWIETSQHTSSTDPLYREHLQEREAFDRLVSFCSVDMNAIPADLRQGGFDMVWSACAMEHLGSLEAGFAFVQEAMRCLKPGGIAVHTTEYNMDWAGPTLEDGDTVLYQRQHIAALEARLTAAGYRMRPFDDTQGPGMMDRFVDLPPYEPGRPPLGFLSPPHLRLSIGGFPATSIGLVIEAGGSPGGA